MSGSLRLKQVWYPSSSLHLTNTLAQSILRQGGYPYENVASGKISYNDTCFYRRYLLSDALTLTAHIGDLRLVSVSTVQHIDDNMTLDQDFLPQSYFTLTQKKRETAFTEDVMLRGLALDGRYGWLTGVYGFYRHQRMEAPVTFKDYGITRLIELHRNQANPYFPIRWDERQFPLDSRFTLPSGAPPSITNLSMNTAIGNSRQGCVLTTSGWLSIITAGAIPPIQSTTIRAGVCRCPPMPLHITISPSTLTRADASHPIT